jgi:rubrerythrin
MTEEQNKTLTGLNTAIQMEIDGKEFYLKASEESSNSLGQKLLNSLASEEDVHRQKFEEIYNIISSRQEWPNVDFQPDWGRRLRTIFARAIDSLGTDAKAPTTELDVVQTAIGMELKSYDLYKEQAVKATYFAEKDFYETVAAEEQEHHLVLLDYYEFLKDPAAWYTNKEHPSLDGG